MLLTCEEVSVTVAGGGEGVGKRGGNSLHEFLDRRDRIIRHSFLAPLKLRITLSLINSPYYCILFANWNHPVWSVR